MKIKDIDRIWCLTGLNPRRIKSSSDEFERLGWDVTYHFNPQTPIIKRANKEGLAISPYYTKLYQSGYKNIFNNTLACFVGHYSIIKTSYMLGYESVLITEDDIKLLDYIDPDYLFDMVPDDYDIVNFYDSIANYTDYDTSDYLFRKHDGSHKIRGFGMYLIKRDIMEIFLDYYEDHVEPCDYLYDHIDCNSYNVYVAKYNIMDRSEIKKSTIKFKEEWNKAEENQEPKPTKIPEKASINRQNSPKYAPKQEVKDQKNIEQCNLNIGIKKEPLMTNRVRRKTTPQRL